MIGNLDEVHLNSTTAPNYPTSGDFDDNIILPSIKGRRIIVPLPFWYTHLPGCEFPICSLDKSNQPEIRITLKPIFDLYTVNEKNTVENVDHYLKTKPSLINNNKFNNKHYIYKNTYVLINKYCKLVNLLKGGSIIIDSDNVSQSYIGIDTTQNDYVNFKIF